MRFRQLDSLIFIFRSSIGKKRVDLYKRGMSNRASSKGLVPKQAPTGLISYLGGHSSADT